MNLTQQMVWIILGLVGALLGWRSDMRPLYARMGAICAAFGGGWIGQLYADSYWRWLMEGGFVKVTAWQSTFWLGGAVMSAVITGFLVLSLGGMPLKRKRIPAMPAPTHPTPWVPAKPGTLSSAGELDNPAPG